MLYVLSRSVLSVEKMLFERSRHPDRHLLTLVQAPLLEQRPVCCYQGIVFLLGARLTTAVSKKPFTCGCGGVRGIKGQILNVESDIVGETYVQAAGKVLLSAFDGIQARQKKPLWGCTALLCALHSSFLPTLHTSIPASSETSCCMRCRRHFH